MTSINVNERPTCEEMIQNKQKWAVTSEESYSEKATGKLLNSKNDNKYFYYYMTQQFYRKGY
jgi:hypothetical protein